MSYIYTYIIYTYSLPAILRDLVFSYLFSAIDSDRNKMGFCSITDDDFWQKNCF